MNRDGRRRYVTFLKLHYIRHAWMQVEGGDEQLFQNCIAGGMLQRKWKKEINNFYRILLSITFNRDNFFLYKKLYGMII